MSKRKWRIIKNSPLERFDPPYYLQFSDTDDFWEYIGGTYYTFWGARIALNRIIKRSKCQDTQVVVYEHTEKTL